MSSQHKETSQSYLIEGEVFTLSQGILDVPIEATGDEQAPAEEVYNAFAEKVHRLLWKTCTMKGEETIVEHGVYYDLYDHYEEGWSLTPDSLKLKITDGAGLCRTWYTASIHWCEYTLALHIDTLDQTLRSKGYKVRGPVEPRNKAQEGVPSLIHLRETLYEIEASSPPQLIDNDKTLAWEELTAEEQAQVMDLLNTRRCGCSFCKLYQGLQQMTAQQRSPQLQPLSMEPRACHTYTAEAAKLPHKSGFGAAIEFTPPRPTATGAIISPDATTLIAMGSDGWLCSWSRDTGELLHTTDEPGTAYSELHWLPGTSTVLFCRNQTHFVLWDTKAWKELGSFAPQYKEYTTNVILWPKQPYIGFVGEYESLEVWSYDPIQRMVWTKDEDDNLPLMTQCIVGPEENAILTHSMDDDSLALVSLSTLRTLWQQQDIQDLCAWTHAYIVFVDQAIQLYSLTGGTHHSIAVRYDTLPSIEAEEGLDWYLETCQLSVDQERLFCIVCDSDERVRLYVVWDIKADKAIASLVQQEYLNLTMAASGQELLMCEEDTIACWPLALGAD